MANNGIGMEIFGVCFRVSVTELSWNLTKSTGWKYGWSQLRRKQFTSDVVGCRNMSGVIEQRGSIGEEG